MTPTEQARRSDSLYYGEITRRELCNLVAHMEADMQEERRAYDQLSKVAADVMRDARELDGELPQWCPRTDTMRVDYGCLHCIHSLKLGGVWLCTYGKEEEENEMES